MFDNFNGWFIIQRKVLVLLFFIVVLTVISYVAIDFNKNISNNSTIRNEANNTSVNQSNVIPLERPPFLEDMKP